MVQGLFSLTGDRRRRTGGAALMVIQAHGLRKRFRVRTRTPGTLGALRGLVMPRRRRITAVDDIELAVDRGEVIAFIGPNGAGKSTTIKLLTGILHRDAGTVSVLGMDPQRHRRRLAYRIATVFGQKSQLWFHLPPIDTFRLLADVYDVECRRAIVINHGRIVWDGAVGELRGSLLATKIMDLKLEAPLVFDQPDVTIRHAGRYTATLEVDTRRARIEAVVRAILKRNTVLDITISDPPMEEVIAALYKSAGHA